MDSRNYFPCHAQVATHLPPFIVQLTSSYFSTQPICTKSPLRTKSLPTSLPEPFSTIPNLSGIIQLARIVAVNCAVTQTGNALAKKIEQVSASHVFTRAQIEPTSAFPSKTVRTTSHDTDRGSYVARKLPPTSENHIITCSFRH